MRRSALIISAIMFCATTVAAQESKKLYLDPGFGSDGKVVDMVTGAKSPVIMAEGNKKPDDCPPHAYWQTGDRIFSCEDDAAYDIGPTTSPAGLFLLVPPRPGTTDDPGPSHMGPMEE